MTKKDLNKLIIESINEVLDESCAACGMTNEESSDVAANIADLEKLLANPDPSRAKDYGSVDKYKDMLRGKIARLKSGEDEPGQEPEYRVRSDEPEPFGYDTGSMDEEYKTDAGKKKAKDRAQKLKKELESIKKAMAGSDYENTNDPQSRLFHGRRLKEISKEASLIRQKIRGTVDVEKSKNDKSSVSPHGMGMDRNELSDFFKSKPKKSTKENPFGL